MEVVNFSLEDFCSNTAQFDCPGDPPEMEANNSSPEDFYSSTTQPDGPWSSSEMGNLAPEHGVLSDTCWSGLSLPIAAMDSISPEMGTPCGDGLVPQGWTVPHLTLDAHQPGQCNLGDSDYSYWY